MARESPVHWICRLEIPANGILTESAPNENGQKDAFYAAVRQICKIICQRRAKPLACMPMYATSGDWHAANDCIGAVGDARSLDEALSSLLPSLGRLFQADVVMWNVYGADMHTTRYRMWPALEVAHLFAPFLQFYPEHPWHANFFVILPQGYASLLSDHISLRTLLRTGLWNEVYIHLYAKHQVCVAGPMGDGNFFTLGINRLGRDYGPRERELVRFMRPKIESTIRSVVRVERTRGLAETLHRFFAHGDNAYAWIDAHGTLREISPEARRLLDAANAGLATDGIAPRPIMTALRRLHALGGRSRRFVSFQLGTLDCVLLSLPASDGAILLVEPQTQILYRDKGVLTRRETEVLQWLGAGKSNREIGILCGISARTVGRHCDNLFAKLGVESRYAAALLARDYREGT